MKKFVVVTAFLLVLVACGAADRPELTDGDIIFHTSKSSQSDALRRAMNSPYTHMGVIFLIDGVPEVLEAVGPVKWTPLEEWIRRGESGRYVVKRLADSSVLTTEAISRLRSEAEQYLGRPYDAHFEWSNDRIYCSELVWKAYSEGLGLELGELQTFRDFNLSDPVVAAKLKDRFGQTIPLDEKVISPASMFDSSQLVTVYSK